MWVLYTYDDGRNVYRWSGHGISHAYIYMYICIYSWLNLKGNRLIRAYKEVG